MLLIDCPYCGPRAQIEFSYGSDASVQRPDPSLAADEPGAAQQWFAHIYLRDNPRGMHLEWWQHTGGCRAWIKVRRDTATHRIVGVWRADDAVPSLDGGAPAGTGSRS